MLCWPVVALRRHSTPAGCEKKKKIYKRDSTKGRNIPKACCIKKSGQITAQAKQQSKDFSFFHHLSIHPSIFKTRFFLSSASPGSAGAPPSCHRVKAAGWHTGPVASSSPHTQPQELHFHDSFLQNMSDISKISTKSNCNLQVFPLKGARCVILNSVQSSISLCRCHHEVVGWQVGGAASQEGACLFEVLRTCFNERCTVRAHRKWSLESAPVAVRASGSLTPVRHVLHVALAGQQGFDKRKKKKLIYSQMMHRLQWFSGQIHRKSALFVTIRSAFVLNIVGMINANVFEEADVQSIIAASLIQTHAWHHDPNREHKLSWIKFSFKPSMHFKLWF